LKQEAFETLFQNTLEELYDAEKQITEALPKMIAACFSEDLSGALQSHLDETKEQVVRLESIFDKAGDGPHNRQSEGMRGLLSEGETAIETLERSAVRDVAIIMSARKVEHYEMAAYTSACAMAELLGQQEVFELLEDTLDEERQADESLAELAKAILSGDSVGRESERAGEARG